MIKIYIASPYTKGDQGLNVHNHLVAANDLIGLGFAPYAPLLFHFQHIFSPWSYETWMDLDLEWLKLCDAVLRLPGESPGADREVEVAKSLGIEVFESINQIVAKYLTKNEFKLPNA